MACAALASLIPPHPRCAPQTTTNADWRVGCWCLWVGRVRNSTAPPNVFVGHGLSLCGAGAGRGLWMQLREQRVRILHAHFMILFARVVATHKHTHADNPGYPFAEFELRSPQKELLPAGWDKSKMIRWRETLRIRRTNDEDANHQLPYVVYRRESSTKTPYLGQIDDRVLKRLRRGG